MVGSSLKPRDDIDKGGSYEKDASRGYFLGGDETQLYRVMASSVLIYDEMKCEHNPSSLLMCPTQNGGRIVIDVEASLSYSKACVTKNGWPSWYLALLDAL